jgi:hypothetical protein
MSDTVQGIGAGIILLLLLASCIHVYVCSARDPRAGDPWMHVALLIPVWPLSYGLWLIWWLGVCFRVGEMADSGMLELGFGGSRGL